MKTKKLLSILYSSLDKPQEKYRHLQKFPKSWDKFPSLVALLKTIYRTILQMQQESFLLIRFYAKKKGR